MTPWAEERRGFRQAWVRREVLPPREAFEGASREYPQPGEPRAWARRMELPGLEVSLEEARVFYRVTRPGIRVLPRGWVFSPEEPWGESQDELPEGPRGGERR